MRGTVGTFLGAFVLMTGTSIAATGASPAAPLRTAVSAETSERIYGVMANLPLADRKVVFRGLSPATKAAVWRAHFRQFSAENALTPAQATIIQTAVNLFSEELYSVSKTDPTWESQVHEPMQRLEQSARNVFPQDLLSAAFAQLGPDGSSEALEPVQTATGRRGFTPMPQQASECTCSDTSDMCWWGSSCGGSVCYASGGDSGCGFGWQYECNGKCHRN
jgi:hypothetical protein